MKVLVVIDAQKDFVTEALRNEEAIKTLPNLVELVKKYSDDPECLTFFTRDTHSNNYLLTLEGKKLPVPHCIEGSDGWEIVDELQPYVKKVLNKYTFGSKQLPVEINTATIDENLDEIIIAGYCTDICVISNALILRAYYPNVPIKIVSNCCAGVTPETHEAALTVARSCQIDVE